MQAKVCIEEFYNIKQLREIMLRKYDAVLGLGWLEQNNPTINWKNKKMLIDTQNQKVEVEMYKKKVKKKLGGVC